MPRMSAACATVSISDADCALLDVVDIIASCVSSPAGLSAGTGPHHDRLLTAAGSRIGNSQSVVGDGARHVSADACPDAESAVAVGHTPFRCFPCKCVTSTRLRGPAAAPREQP